MKAMEIIFHTIEFILAEGLVYLQLCLTSTLVLKCPFFYQNNVDSTRYLPVPYLICLVNKIKISAILYFTPISR